MTDPQTTAVEQAIWAYAHRDTMDKQTRLDHVIALAAWGVYSNRQVALLTGMDPHDVAAYSGKTDRTGGNLNPDALPLILDLIHIDARGEVDFFAVKRALDAGVSGRMLARLTGRSQVTLARHARRAKEMIEGRKK